MVDILYPGRASHIINFILMTFAAAAALWFCFAGNLQNAAIVAGLGLQCAVIFISFMVAGSGKRWPTGVMLMLVVLFAFTLFTADSGAITHLSENRTGLRSAYGGEWSCCSLADLARRLDLLRRRFSWRLAGNA